MLALQPFLTAYDPSDLPGSSVDPLGFDRAYTFLADKILPGLTNVASRPRYFSVLCAAIMLSDETRLRSAEGETPRARYNRRLGAMLRLERFWTLACVLASEGEEALDTGGIRGILYVVSALKKLRETQSARTDGEFKLLSRQMTYGMVGIYGSVADGLRFIERDTLALVPDLGGRLADAFIRETELPPVVRRATCSEDAAVGFKTLKKWALRSHVNRLPGRDELSLLRDAFEGNDVRRRTGKLLQKVPRGAHEHELDRLRRVLSRLEDSEAEQDIAESIRVILLFEECFRLSLLVFQRLLWFCQQVPPFALPLADAAEDSVLSRVKTQIARCGPKLDAAIAGSQTPRFRQELERLADTNSFVQGLATAGSTTQMIERVLARHRDVQRAKSDGGRPKMPWLEIRNGRVVPTLSAAQRIPRGPESLSQVLAHPYRTVAADRFHRNGIA